jgi:hypothetical protein
MELKALMRATFTFAEANHFWTLILAFMVTPLIQGDRVGRLRPIAVGFRRKEASCKLMLRPILRMQKRLIAATIRHLDWVGPALRHQVLKHRAVIPESFCD